MIRWGTKTSTAATIAQTGSSSEPIQMKAGTNASVYVVTWLISARRATPPPLNPPRLLRACQSVWSR